VKTFGSEVRDPNQPQRKKSMPVILAFAEDSIQLVPDGTMLLHIAIILLMVYLLNVTLYKPINQILAAREKRTRGRMSEAQEITQNITDKLGEYETSLRQARSEAYAFAESQRGEAMKGRQQRLDETREQMAASLAREKETIKQQAAVARGELETDARRLAAEIGGRVLKRPVSDVNVN
jgi:F-type H+-transporting ATPase subunit b